eukprot:scaffold602_cov298-Pinguiococcus_pyrenoidosus.AAC.3
MSKAWPVRTQQPNCGTHMIPAHRATVRLVGSDRQSAGSRRTVEGEGERDSVGAGDGAVAAAAQELRALVRAARVGREAVVVGCAAEEAVAVADHEVGLSTELVDVLHLELARRGAARHLGVDGAAGQAGADQRHVLVVGEGAVAAHTQADLQVGEAAGARRADEVAVLAEAGVAHDPVFLVRSDGHGAMKAFARRRAAPGTRKAVAGDPRPTNAFAKLFADGTGAIRDEIEH